ncbi:MAG: urea ABC transporter permease subunit UrtB [Gammaproteobacteria bacterium]|nr:urea ABC transporter permease subunit UrtB [Gammaproteobacteria bacterium]
MFHTFTANCGLRGRRLSLAWNFRSQIAGRTALVLLNCLLSLVLFAGDPDQLYAQNNEQDSNEIISGAFDALTGKDKAAKFAAIEELARSTAPRKQLWLDALLNGELYRVKKEQTLVLATKGENKLYDIFNAVDGELLGSVKKRTLKKIVLDNRARSQLRALLDGLELENPDPAQRHAAVMGLIGSASESQVGRVREQLQKESDPAIKESMQLLVSLFDLQQGDIEAQQNAMSFVQGNLSPQVVTALTSLANSSPDAAVKETASTLLVDINQKLKRMRLLETLFFGISLGSVLVVAAIGLAITFGVMGVINMAHGELIMLGAYTTYFVQQLLPGFIEYSLLLALPAAFLVSGTVGIVIERLVIRHLYGRPLETLLATFGISLLLQQLVRTVVSPQNVAVVNPAWMSGSIAINPALSLTLNRLVILLFCLVVFSLLVLFLSRSKFGLQMRSVVQNRQMARAMGIRSGRIDSLTFGLGAGVAGLAGVALSQIGNVGPNLGQSYIIDSFMVVVFGGVGNLWGTLVAGMSLGIVNKFIEPWAGAVLAKIVILVFIILFIQSRPRGLFPQRGRAVES